MYERVYRFLDTCKILYPLQFGFREKHSTLHAIIGMTDTTREAIDNGMFGCGVFIDLQLAFDTASQFILLKKLEHYGIKGLELSWFSSYLLKRKRFVSVNDSTSDHPEVSFGVPQGSVLSPLLFLVYINDLPSVSKALSFYVFADDTYIFYNSGDVITLQKVMMTRGLKKVKQWLDANELALNIDKTSCYFSFPSEKNY